MCVEKVTYIQVCIYNVCVSMYRTTLIGNRVAISTNIHTSTERHLVLIKGHTNFMLNY